MSPIKRGMLSVLLVVACTVGPGAVAYALWSAPATGTMAVTVASATPAAPGSFRCTSFHNATQVNLAWNTVTGTTIQYQVHQRTGTAPSFTYTAIDKSTTNTSIRIKQGDIPSSPASAVLVVRARSGSSGSFGDVSNAVLVTFGSSGRCDPA